MCKQAHATANPACILPVPAHLLRTCVQLRGRKVLQRRMHLSMQLRERGPHKRQPLQIAQQLRPQAADQGACSQQGWAGVR